MINLNPIRAMEYNAYKVFTRFKQGRFNFEPK